MDAHLLAIEESGSDGPGEPIASKTPLGLVVRVIGVDSSIPVRILAITDSSAPYAELGKQMKRFYDTESFGSETRSDYISEEGKQALRI